MQKQTFTLIICILLITIVLGGAGYIYKSKADRADAMVKTLSSKLVSPLMAFGNIKNISGKDVTLDFDGNTILVKMADDARIFTIDNGTQKEGTLGDIKVGDFVNVNLTIAQDYTIEGNKIMVNP